jgi:septum formation topological specificity factor MinE
VGSVKNIAGFVCERLKNVIISDKTGTIPAKLNGVLEKDLGAVLSDYFNITDICAEVKYEEDGEAYVRMLAKIGSFKPVNFL